MCYCHEDKYDRCNTHLGCDDRDCEALREPKTLEEYKVVIEHYETHGWLHGCACCGS